MYDIKIHFFVIFSFLYYEMNIDVLAVIISELKFDKIDI